MKKPATSLSLAVANIELVQTRITHSAELCERQWTVALDHFVRETSLVTLQCLILAQIYCIQKGDFDRLLHYKGLAIAIAHRLGLHLSQKRFALGVLTVETRKKVFWTLYTLDWYCLPPPAKLIWDSLTATASLLHFLVYPKPYVKMIFSASILWTLMTSTSPRKDFSPRYQASSPNSAALSHCFGAVAYSQKSSNRIIHVQHLTSSLCRPSPTWTTN